jgi:hypothetical protein
LANPCNVTHLSIKFIMFNQNMNSIFFMKSISIFFCKYLDFGIFIRLWTLDPIMFPTNLSEFYALNYIFSFKVCWTRTHIF